MDDLLDFASDIGEEDDDEDHNKPRKALPPLNPPPNGLAVAPPPFDVFDPSDDSTRPLPVSLCLNNHHRFFLFLLSVSTAHNLASFVCVAGFLGSTRPDSAGCLTVVAELTRGGSVQVLYSGIDSP